MAADSLGHVKKDISKTWPARFKAVCVPSFPPPLLPVVGHVSNSHGEV